MRSRTRCPAFAARRSCWKPRLRDEDRALTRLITDETDRIVSLVDRMEVFSDERPIDRYPVNIHVVLDHVKAIARNGFASRIKIFEDYDPSLPPVFANRDQLVQVFLNLVKNAAEAIGSDPHGEITLSTAFRPGIRVSVAGHARTASRCRSNSACATMVRAFRKISCRSCSIRSSPPSRTARGSAWRWSPRSSASMAASSNAIRRRAAPPSAS